MMLAASSICSAIELLKKCYAASDEQLNASMHKFAVHMGESSVLKIQDNLICAYAYELYRPRITTYQSYLYSCRIDNRYEKNPSGGY